MLLHCLIQCFKLMINLQLFNFQLNSKKTPEKFAIKKKDVYLHRFKAMAP